jgi:hypothetical protein
MTMQSYSLHIFSNGEVAPISDWTGGETDVEIHIEVPETEEHRKAAGRKFFDTWNGLLEGMPDMTAKEIRAERLERKYGQ